MRSQMARKPQRTREQIEDELLRAYCRQLLDIASNKDIKRWLRGGMTEAEVVEISNRAGVPLSGLN
jgi:hypothetical protein